METNIRKILVPVDFSENSKAALEYAHSFIKMFNAELILTHIIEPIVYPPDFSLGQITLPTDDLKEIENRVRSELAKWAEDERNVGIKTKSIIATGKPFLEIIQIAKDEDVDLIIISSHGHTGMEHILFGSTSEKVVRKAPCPVLTVRVPLKGFDYKKAFA
ncbi:MAG: universal stress protein [Ignavibacteria bacterium]|nr:universal stress protein [Ignavibacteria bacterium]